MNATAQDTIDLIEAAFGVSHVSGCTCSRDHSLRADAQQADGFGQQVALGDLGIEGEAEGAEFNTFANAPRFGGVEPVEGAEDLAIEWSLAEVSRYAGRYGFAETVDGLIEGGAAIVEQAFDVWEAVLNVDFVQVMDGGDVDIRVGGGNIDGAAGTLGVARTAFIGQEILYSDIYLDAGEFWSAGHDGINMLSVLIHEIGHALGLDHTGATGSILQAYYSGQTHLGAADIAGGQFLYGANDDPAPVDPALVVTFDAAYYLANNADVAAAGIDAWSHFQAHGWREGRDPNAYFDTSAYLELNGDVAAIGMNPFDHYVHHGIHEGREAVAVVGAAMETADLVLDFA